MSAERRRSHTRAPSWLRDAIAYHSEHIDEQEIGADWSDAHTHCIRCGYPRKLQRCHIVPRMLGGSDDPSNLIGLCAQCHDEQPDVADPDEVWRWIKSDSRPFYETYWAHRAMNLLADDERAALERVDLGVLREVLSQTGYHCGQAHGGVRVKPSTMAWALRTAIANSRGDS